MRKFILIAALVLVSATAQASGTRGLTLASNDDAVAAEPPKAAEAPAPAETPKYVERPAAVDTAVPTPKAEPAKPVADKGIQPPKTARPKHRRDSTEARVINALHRHGIYW
jgi:hypothetical protein